MAISVYISRQNVGKVVVRCRLYETKRRFSEAAFLDIKRVLGSVNHVCMLTGLDKEVS